MLEIVIMPDDGYPVRIAVGVMQGALTRQLVDEARKHKCLPQQVRTMRMAAFEQHFQQFETGHA